MSLASRSPHSPGQSMTVFDYESKIWGAHEVRLAPTYLGAMRLEYCLRDLEGVRGNVLEVGCGAGGMAKAIKSYRSDLQVLGCDISLPAIRTARQVPEGVAFEVGTAYDLPYEDESFQAVVMFDVLEHLEKPHQCIAEIYRVLEAGGLFHLYVPCEGALYTLHGLLAMAGWRAKEIYGGHIQRLTSGEVAGILEAAGFSISLKRWSGHLINQAVDAAYFMALSMRRQNNSSSVEGYLESAQPGLLPKTIGAIKSAIAVASYYESKHLRWLPGFGIHVESRKHHKMNRIHSTSKEINVSSVNGISSSNPTPGRRGPTKWAGREI